MHRATPEKPDVELSGDIASLRAVIDEVDEKIMGLVNQRLSLATQIGALKKKSATPIKDSAREEEIMQRLGNKNSGPLTRAGLRRVFAAIIAECRCIQQTG